MNEKTSAASATRGFWCLISTQFQAAFSDNVLIALVIFLIPGTNDSIQEKQNACSFVGAMFALPFILFSTYGGYFADRFSKRTVTIALKTLEFALVGFVCVGLTGGSRGILIGGVFFSGVLAALFGPSKSGLIPEILPERKLSWGNGILIFGTSNAAILGIVTAVLIQDYFGFAPLWPTMVLMTLATAGLVASLGITAAPAADPRRKFRVNFASELLKQFNSVRRDRLLALAFAGNTYFNFIGCLLLLNLFFYTKSVPEVGDPVILFFTIALVGGLGAGSIVAGYASSEKIEHGLAPLGAVGISIVSVALSAPAWGNAMMLGWLAVIGFAGGFLIVPVSAVLQHEPESVKRGEVLAAANWLSFGGIYLGWGTFEILRDVLGQSPRMVFLVCGFCTFAGTITSLVLFPYSLVRAIVWLATHTIYRVRVEGLENLPRRGGALIISNHVSFVDWLLLMAAADRPVRFLMGTDYYDKAWVRPLARVPRVIPIPPQIRPHEVIKALTLCAQAIREGDAVCIFAEGGITRTGELQSFRRGFERMMESIAHGSDSPSSNGNGADQLMPDHFPIVPAALTGIWGSVFSFSGGKLLWKKPGPFPRVVTVRFGRPLPATATAVEARARVLDLMK